MSVTTTIPRVETGFLGEGRHIFVCKKFPFEILRSANFPTPNENLIDENFAHKLNLMQSNIMCENYRLGSETVRLVGKISTTIQTVSEGVVIGSMQLKATVVRDLKLLFGTEALPGLQLSQKLSKYETSRNLHELCSMKTKKKNVKTEPTKIKKLKEIAKPVDQSKKPANLDKHSKESYFQTLVAKFNDMRTEINESLPSFGSYQGPKPNQESPHHNIAHDDLASDTPTDDEVNDDLDSLQSDIPPQPELCEDSDDEENAEPCVTPTRLSQPVLEQGYNGVWHYPGEKTPPLFDSPSFPSWKAALDEEYGRQKSPTSNVSTPQSSKSQHWYKDRNQKTHAKSSIAEDPRNLFRMKRLSHVDLPHGPLWCCELCQHLKPRYLPVQCGYTGKDLPDNFMACSYSCTGAWCSCVASYSGRDYWS